MKSKDTAPKQDGITRNPFPNSKKIYVKGKYPCFLSNCLLLTCAKKNTMMKIINQIKIFLKKYYLTHNAKYFLNNWPDYNAIYT